MPNLDALIVLLFWLQPEEETDTDTPASGNSEEQESGAFEEDDEQLPSEEEKQWRALHEEKREQQDDEVFECFVLGQDRWKAANEQLEASLEHSYTKMEEAGIFVVEDLITPIFSVEREKLRTLEAKCRKQLFDNHHRREKFYNVLDKAERTISADIKKLKAKTLDVLPNTAGIGEASPSNVRL